MVQFGATYSFVKLVNGISLTGDFVIRQMSLPMGSLPQSDSTAPWFVAGEVFQVFGDDDDGKVNNDSKVVIPLSSVAALQ